MPEAGETGIWALDPLAFEEMAAAHKGRRIRIAEQVLSEELDGQAVVLNAETGIYYALNGSATQIWKLIEQHRELSRVRQGLHEIFREDPERLDRDLDNLVSELAERKLICLGDEA